ncbi:MAG TPA: YbhB/YbcL family Raf kinase inhibitor-like protein, partial [Synergistaceae bacterium]|nr:YbhB/YbcL family Raf kinase inhibitor-like protein [Synergistaceae bacterium]
ARLDLAPGASKASLLESIKGHILAQARLVGRYGR